MVSCVVNQNVIPNTATTAVATVVCPGVSAAVVGGSVIGKITLMAKGSFDDSAISPAYNGQLKFTFTEDSAQFNVPALSANAPNGGPNDVGSTGTLTASQGGLSLSSLSGFNVAVLESLLSGGRLPSNSNVTVAYDYLLMTVVPEPSAYLLIGLGLSAVAFYRRK